MSDSDVSLGASHDTGRLLTFEVDGHIYALPIGGILEVAGAGAIRGVPTLPRSLAGVMNWHGDALPVVATRLIVTPSEDAEEMDPADLGGGVAGMADAAPLEAEHVLVVSDRIGEPARLGLPIDSVLGLVDDSQRSHAEMGEQVVVERRSVDGRVVSVLDPRRLVARANQVIERLAA